MKERCGAFLPAVILCLVFGCSASDLLRPQVSAAYTACGPQMAEVLVGDGFLKPACGCQEDPTGSGPATGGGQLFSCTVPVGTALVFVFSGDRLKHQILFLQSSGLPSSSIINPLEPNTQTQHAITLDHAGTFLFRDAYDGSIQGNIVAQ